MNKEEQIKNLKSLADYFGYELIEKQPSQEKYTVLEFTHTTNKSNKFEYFSENIYKPNFGDWTQPLEYILNIKEYTITKVQYTSPSGETKTFQIGDEVKGSLLIELYFRINLFTYNNGFIYAHGGSCPVKLKNLSLIIKQTQPLFEDFLGNDIYDGDTYYFINTVTKDKPYITTCIASKNNDKMDDKWIKFIFKYSIDAENRLIQDTPLFSIKNIKEIAFNKLSQEVILHINTEELESIARQKLNL